MVSTLFPAVAQVNFAIYGDHLSNGFQDWSWGSRDLTNASPVHSGSHSISASLGYWQAVSFAHADMDTSAYASLSFWVNGGPKGGQVLTLQGILGQTAQTACSLGSIPANQWKRFNVSLTTLGIAEKPNFTRFWIQLSSSGTTNTFFLDDVELIAKPVPTLTTLQVSANQRLRTVDPRLFGVNAAVWDGDLDSDWTASALREMGIQALRFPGGSLADEYHWATGISGTNNWKWSTSFRDFAHLATNVGARVCLTVNYGSGSPAEAAAWVRSANVTNRYGFQYWEIGNENYGAWETDTNARPHDPYTYALRAQAYISQMKAVDPAIRVGVVGVMGEDNYANYSDHPALNARTGVKHNGWTPVLLSTLKSLGVTPDFVVYHRYSQNPTGESDTALLLSSASWAADAADLRQQISDYIGASGSGIELLCTENNSVSSNPGKQTTSLVNALFMADSFCQLALTEFNSFFWWDLRNGRDFTFNRDDALYGWRDYGDYGMVYAQSDRYPVFYAAKLLSRFVNPGDALVRVTSDNPLLAAYAARHASGALSLLVINKCPTNVCLTQVNLDGFTPGTNAGVLSYGIPQDTAARTGIGSADLAESTLPITGASFTCSFAPYSLTVLTLPPPPPSLRAENSAAGRDCVVTLSGETGARYVLQTSSNLVDWVPFAESALESATLSVSVPCDARQQYWRAVWMP
jgi:hypothetical protein